MSVYMYAYTFKRDTRTCVQMNRQESAAVILIGVSVPTTEGLHSSSIKRKMTSRGLLGPRDLRSTTANITTNSSVCYGCWRSDDDDGDLEYI